MYDWSEILGWFYEDASKIEQPDEIIYAEYDNGGYDGQAKVLFYDQGKFWYVCGSHCSCYGLEEQWNPEEYSIEALRGQVERAQWGFFKDQAQLILDACDKYESSVSQLAATLSRNETRMKQIQSRLSSLEQEQVQLESEYELLSHENIKLKEQIKNLL